MGKDCSKSCCWQRNKRPHNDCIFFLKFPHSKRKKKTKSSKVAEPLEDEILFQPLNHTDIYKVYVVIF